MDRLLHGRFAEEMEDWSGDFALSMDPQPTIAPTKTTSNDDDEEDDEDDDMEDWDKELTCTTLDYDGYASQREENNSFFRSLLPNVDLLGAPPSPLDDRLAPSSPDAKRATLTVAGLPDSQKLLENAHACFRNAPSGPPPLASVRATPLLTLEADGFPAFNEVQLHDWLKNVVQTKDEAALAEEASWLTPCDSDIFLHAKGGIAAMRLSLASFGARLSHCIRRRRLVDARKLLEAYFRDLELESSLLVGCDADAYILGGWSMEILQLAIEALQPTEHDVLFADYVALCGRLYPAWHAVWALLECRYVLHHWSHYESGKNYSWQMDLVLDTGASLHIEPGLGQTVALRYLSLLSTADDPTSSCPITVALDMGLLSLGTSAIAIHAAVLCDIQAMADRRSPLHDVPIPSIFHDDPPAVLAHAAPSSSLQLLEPDGVHRLEWLESLYARLEMPHDTLLKAKCAYVLGRSMLHSTTSLCEALAMEGLRLLDVGYGLAFLPGPSQRQGVLGPSGRDTLELLGAALQHNKKYPFAIAAYESAARVYCFEFINRRGYEKLDRLCSSVCLHEGDLDRALLYHDRVLQWTKELENCHEFVFIVQMINGILLQQCHFQVAEQRLASAFVALQDPSVPNLPPPCLAQLPPRSFHFKLQHDLDGWLQHMISLHLCLRDVYRATGRWQDALAVLQHLLAYEANYRLKLPRGKRVALTLLVAEDALKMRQLELCLSMLRTIEAEANDAKDHRHALETMGSFRYIRCRFRCYLFKAQFHRASFWLGLAAAKASTVREQADVALYGARCLFALHARSLHESAGLLRATSSRWNTPADGPMLRLLTSHEQRVFQAYMENHWTLAGSYADEAIRRTWSALDLFRTLNDSARQLKALLVLIDASMDAANDVASSSLESSIKQALVLAGETARPMHMVRALVACATVRCWHLQTPTVDVVQLYEQALLLLQAVFLRRTESVETPWQPLLPFAPSVLAQLERVVASLLLIGAHLTRLEWSSPSDLLSLTDLQRLYWSLNATTYWTTSTSRDAAAPTALPDMGGGVPRTASGTRLPRSVYSHQKQLSLSSLSDMMAAVFRRPNDPFLVVAAVPDPPFAYVGPLHGHGALHMPLPDVSRVRSYSAPVGHEGSASSNADWDDTDLELEVDGADFWHACSQEHRKHTMALAASYEALDGAWGDWHAAATANTKYMSGRLTPAAYRLANLRLIYDLNSRQTLAASSSSSWPPQHPWPWSILLPTATQTTVALVQPQDEPLQVTRFRSAHVADWRAHVTKLSLNPTLQSLDISRVLRLLGPKVLIKVLSSILLETPLIVVSSSVTLVHEVIYAILFLLKPFQWHYLVAPYLSLASLTSLLDLLRLYTQHKTSTTSEPPFIVGVALDTWRECAYQLSRWPLAKACGGCISVLHVEKDTPSVFQKASNPAFAVHLPSKLRKLVVEAASTEHATPSQVMAAIDRVYDIVLRSCQKTHSFKQWFRLENLEFVKLFQLTWTYQSYLKTTAESV
ncbi:hypothetical protein SPRG_02288 [Saprolegnia parasitica CBS 223.65]|uniref:cDENN domain-containing protein n=1 Tax=Saprolegnia parasitica (strain CBS 223.65) TaxID=695850 RepID=A0A067CW29_SAPPC|nr:hypothetical protein SPRG_02288 [Saprolegnia parasitica CBS 223.65]KDO33480.1 hypothetical protein SPRG_02288 [Saprolegnia parasitica CBS 223.65]|eukprot:XP_012196224.1 hypothetical protein SPRG_02288 [Saprolegnia parasitica CBS 223.65]